MILELDHLAVAGQTLAEATEAVEAALGVRLQPGGQHARFGTHNSLLGLAEGLYLEAISVDPAAAPPDQPRWFDLDRFEGPARLTNWICRTPDLVGICAALPDLGPIHKLERGDLRWQMAVPRDGRLPFDNRHPAVMQWPDNNHPAARLSPSGCQLTRLTIMHAEAEALNRTLKPYLKDDRVAFETAAHPALHAAFQTPHGPRELS